MNSFTQIDINDSIQIDDSFPRYHPFDSTQLIITQPKSDFYAPIMMNNDKPGADDAAVGGGGKGNMVPLPLDFVPGDFDVLCGRGKKNYNSLGNQRLRQIVESYVEQYSAASSRQDKSDILSAIVNEVRQCSPHGGFIKQDTTSERWFEVGDFLAREKVSQAFRDALSSRYRSSKKFKHEKRRQRDRAAKLAKLKGESKTGEESKSPSKTPPAPGAEPLVNKQSLLVLREDTNMPSGSAVPPLQPSVQPSRPMSVGPGLSSSALLEANRQAILNADGPQLPMAGTRGYHFNTQGVLPNQGASSMVHGHNSWPQMFANPQFNQLNAGAGNPMTMPNMRQMANRRFSSNMAQEVNQMPFQQFHQSDPNPRRWSQHLQDASAASQMMPNNNEMAGFNAAFLAGMNMQHPGGGMMSNTSAMLPSMMPASQSMTTNTMIASNTHPRRRGPVARNDSNISTTSATAIVARLESSLTNLDHDDENPFEPVPLPDDESEDHW